MPRWSVFFREQGVRNLRLRLVYAYVMRRRQKNYDRFVRNNTTAMFVQLSEVVRLRGGTIPTGFPERVKIFEREFAIDGGVLHELLALKRAPHRFTRKHDGGDARAAVSGGGRGAAVHRNELGGVTGVARATHECALALSLPAATRRRSIHPPAYHERFGFFGAIFRLVRYHVWWRENSPLPGL